MSAMEAALVSTILKIVGKKLVPLVTNEFSSIAGVNKNLEDLQRVVDRINYWLEKVGDKAIRNEKSSNWLKPLKDVAYDAEDLVHEFQLKAEKLDGNVVGHNNIAIKYLWTKPKSVVFKRKIAHKIKVIKKRFDVIVKEISDYNTITNSIGINNHPPHTTKTIGEVPSLTNIDEASIFGRDQLKLQLISELIKPHDQQKIKIVSVIGLGGSGKTALAKLVYNDGNIIMQHFEEKLWVHVSPEFSIEKLVEKLFEAINGDKADHHTCQHMSRIISERLAGKKFLLVLDDVWTEDRLEWEQFMVNIRGGAPGSSILLTTRNRQVAEAVDNTYKYDLPPLSIEDSWKVFLQSFGRAMETLDSEFRQVGTDIVKKCAGVPLAIKVLAGVLHGMKRIEDWQSIRDNNLLDVENEQDGVSNCLLLSYIHLPHHLKQCFTYCSIFPRGYVINRRHMISQWIAHGFIELKYQAQQPEDVGDDYFVSLLSVGFLQDLEKYWSASGEETTCKMHDLLHDLGRQILQDEFVSEIATTDQIKRCRYLSLTSGTKEVDTKLFDKVRALYILRSDITLKKPLSKRCWVRAIILKRIRPASLPLFISKFEHLLYLEIFNVTCEALPEAVSHCWNLQFIHVINCRRLAALPESIGKLKKLRTLELTGCLDASTLPQSIGDCSNLQNLYLYNCGLKDIPDSFANIDKLRVLSIVDCSKVKVQQMLSSESFGKLCNLRTVTLKSCMDLQCLPQCITSLTHLEYLDLAMCYNLVELPEGIGNLEKLEVLNLQRCLELCGLPAGCGQMTRLQKLGLFVIGDSTKHARISELENLDKLNGKLNITNINNVNDPCDAEKVHLKKKNGIRKLSLDWDSWRARKALEESEMEKELSLDWDSRGHSWARNALEESEMEKDLYLLNSLEPPSEIEKLRISGYRGSQLPRWIMKQSDYCDLDDMHMPEHTNPPQFSHLTKLVLENLSNLEHLEGLVHLPGIKILKLRRMPKLLELLTTRTCLAYGDKEVEVQYCFPGLYDLVLSDCPKLNVKPHFPSSLKRLTVDQSNEQLLSSGSFVLPHHAHGSESAFSSCTLDAKPPQLTELTLGRLIESSSGWNVLRHLTGLQVLKIRNCRDLRQLPESMRSLTSLHWLEINSCYSLLMLPDWLGELQSLDHLFICTLPKVHTLPQSIQHLTALRSLEITNCLRSLPSLPHSLRLLMLSDCYELTQLPESLGELSALRVLSINNHCGLTSLPHSIQRLSALQELHIFDCPELANRCKEGVGEDWHLVSHIPDLILRKR